MAILLSRMARSVRSSPSLISSAFIDSRLTRTMSWRRVAWSRMLPSTSGLAIGACMISNVTDSVILKS